MNTDTLLHQLAQERDLHSQADDTKMSIICEQLMKAGVYSITPFMEENEYSALDMVISWGVDWHIFREPQECRHCGSDLRNLNTGPPFKLEVGVTLDRDRSECFECPDCGMVI